ncbi:MAG: cation diffusion facilitator family transporter [Candidatus Gastranaerophilales bacterium]|nr:cation diffusion facilitator family transporter [Candidatus Gastranaerophilales bacterium]
MQEEHEIQIISENEKRILIVVLFTIVAMLGEIGFGLITNSMSLLAEGIHMAVHVLTLSITYAAYIFARKLKNSDLFPKGTQKIGTLAAYTSSMFLAITGFAIIYESVMRFFTPEEILFTEAIIASVFAFVINFICIIVMEGKLHLHCHFDSHTDYNYKAAYYHILADIIVSVLTIFALVGGKYFNCIHLDALTGIIGAILILIWAYKLLKHTVKILIDMK